ncbi:MAG: MATE family efflux transporter, partial [Lachnospiraceae bacterium]|nr:MATE family efflux transporter [Lachnospiraceae bacterium]
CIFMGVLLFFFGNFFISLFLDADSSANAIRIGSEYLRIVGSFYFILGLLYITTGLLRGAGDATMAMIATLVNFAFRVAFAYISVAITKTESMIWWSNLVGWCFGFLVAYIRYRSGKWKQKSVLKSLE